MCHAAVAASTAGRHSCASRCLAPRRQIKEELFRYRRLIANTLTQSFRDTAVGLVIVGQRGAEPAPVAPLQDDAGGSGWTDADAVRFEEQLDLYIRPQIAGLLRVRASWPRRWRGSALSHAVPRVACAGERVAGGGVAVPCQTQGRGQEYRALGA